MTPRAAVRDAHRELAIDTERFDQVAGAGALRVALQDGRNANDVVASWRAPLESLAASRRRYPRY
ncbi:MAG: hypothetical protein AUH85_04860 [Chloroflexi bacterium 13_1_40CM_4_68_4]|nr:MAG: hypothetical protein AUH85_04860 [Chloroflexi bacterium 13_1_40CM_4_68_4]